MPAPGVLDRHDTCAFLSRKHIGHVTEVQQGVVDLKRQACTSLNRYLAMHLVVLHGFLLRTPYTQCTSRIAIVAILVAVITFLDDYLITTHVS